MFVSSYVVIVMKACWQSISLRSGSEYEARRFRVQRVGTIHERGTLVPTPIVHTDPGFAFTFTDKYSPDPERIGWRQQFTS